MRYQALVVAIQAVSDGGDDLDAVLTAITQQVRAVLCADDSGLHLGDPRAGTVLRARQGNLFPRGSPHAYGGDSYEGDAFMREAAERRRPLFTPDFQHDPRVHAGVKGDLPGVVASMTIPMVAGDEVLGEIFLHWVRAFEPTPEDLEVADALGRHAAVAVRTAIALDEARRAHAELEAVLDAASAAILVFSPDGRIVRANPHGRAMMARLGQPVETLGELRAAASAASATLAAGGVHAIGRALEGGSASDLWTIPCRDGGRTVVHVSAAPIRDGRAPRGAVVVATDVTAAQDAAAAQARLEGAIVTARTVAHELNNKLQLIGGYSAIALAHPCTPDGVAAVAEIAQAASETSALASQLARIVRIAEVDGPVGPMLDLAASTS